MAETYYRTKFTFEVLSDRPITNLDLDQIARQCDSGDCVGSALHAEVTEITSRELAAATYEFGSEPGFFGFDDNGEPIHFDDLRVSAECHSDDHRIEIKFDAMRWFMQANDEQILELARCEWGGDYPADEVAEFFKETTTKELFDYVALLNKDGMGFECNIDVMTAKVWLRHNRPALLEQIESGASTTL